MKTPGNPLVIFILFLAFLCAFVLTSDRSPAQEAVSFDQAMEMISRQLEAGHGQSPGPKVQKRSGGKGGEVKFRLAFDPDGRSITTTRKNTFGVTLRCRAMILEPEGDYNVRVGTNAGSIHSFSEIPTNREVVFDLKTKGGLSRTEFFVELISLAPPSGGEALVTMRYIY